MRRILILAIAFGLLLTPVSAIEIGGGDGEISWDAYILEFFDEYSIDPKTLMLGYYNTVTGEEHYHNGNKYIHGASIYKVPLNMYFAELVSSGEMTMDTMFYGRTYAEVQRLSVQFSDNDVSERLQKEFDTYVDYRIAISKYLGASEEDFTEEFLNRNIFTARQMVHCLKMLYAEPERYPNVLDNMLAASPGGFLKLYIGDEYEIAQKYGFFNYKYSTYLHSVGIIYTQEPIIVTIYTYGCRGGERTLGHFAEAMIEYAEMTASASAGTEETEVTPEPTPEPTPEMTPEPAPEESPDGAAQPVSSTNIAEAPNVMPEVTTEPVPQETQPPAVDSTQERDAAMPIYIAFAMFAAAAVLGLIFKKKPLVIIALAAIAVCAAALIALRA